MHDIPLDASFLAAALAATMLCAALAGLLPVRRSARPTNPLLATVQVSGRREEQRLRRALAIVQVGFAFALLVVAGLMVRSLGQVLAMELGFEPRGVLAVQLSSDLQEPDERLGFYRSLFQRVQALPGMSGVAASTRLPLREGGSARIEVQDERAREEDRPEVEVRRASRDYFRTMGITLVAGRPFSPDDRLGSPGVAIVNQTAASRLWPGASPLGQRLRLVRLAQEAPWLSVIGVVGNIRHFGLESAPRPEIYLSLEQGPPFGALLVARSSGPPEVLAVPIREAVRSLDPKAAIVDVVPMERLLASALAPRRYTVWLLSLFGGLAITLAFVGVYATVSHVMARRRREVAVRMSLGATATGILGLALADAFWYALPGLALGVAAGLAATRLLGTLLYGVAALDPFTFLLVLGGVGLMVVMASFVPACRAARLDPAAVLRSE